MRCIDRLGAQQARIEHEVFQVGLEQGMCLQQLQEAQVGQRVMEEMVRDRRVNRHIDPRPRAIGCGRPA